MSGRRSRGIQPFRYAIAGIVEALRREPHMRFHLAAALLVIAVAAWLRVASHDWLWLLAAITGVWVSELLNTAIERTVDIASPDIHPLARIAKDTAAGAVLASVLFAVIVGAIVLGPPLWKACFH